MRIHFEDIGQDLFWIDVDANNLVTDTNCEGPVDEIWRGARIGNIAVGENIEAYLPTPDRTVTFRSKTQATE